MGGDSGFRVCMVCLGPSCCCYVLLVAAFWTNGSFVLCILCLGFSFCCYLLLFAAFWANGPFVLLPFGVFWASGRLYVLARPSNLLLFAVF